MSRIAYIFFGQVKNFDEKQYEAFQQNVGDKLKDHEVDYFLTTSRSTKYNSPRQQDSEGQEVSIDPESVQKYFDFKDVFYDDQSRESKDISGLAKKLVSFGDAWNSHSSTSTENSLKQLYGLEYFWHQFKGLAENYDVFVLSRCDLFHTHAFDVDCLSKDVDLLTPYYDGFEEIDYGQFGGLNDRFAVVKNVFSLAVYCARYSSIKKSPQYYHAEKYLKEHIENHKLTTDRIHNFYFLLYRANCKISDLVGIGNDEQMNTELNGIDKSYFINLDRRLDRLSHIYKNNPFFTQRVSAIDAKKIQLNDEVKKLFPKTWSSRSKAEICCAISHYRLWKKLAHEKGAANYLILEDDAVFKDGFVKFWNAAFSKQMPNDYSIIYLGGCQPWNKPHYPNVLEQYNDYFYRIKKNDFFTKDDYFWHMNASSYVLSKTAASLLCQWVEQNGMDDALDNFIQRFFNENKLFAAPKSIYHLNPLMSYQLHEENDNTEIDKNSDLRYAAERFNENEKISVIIPTIWKANDYIMRSLLDLDKVDCIEEVIVIDNDKTKTPHWIKDFKKVKLIDSGKRMYFNESVNFGIDLCKNDICCIYNDDITSDTRVFDYVRKNLTEKDGCIFISPQYINKKKPSSGNLKKVNDNVSDGLRLGSGMMMFLRKQGFIKIPSKLIHHFGDTFIFEINKRQSKQNYIVEGFPIETPGSASEDDSVKQVINKDWKVHREIFDNLDDCLKGKIVFPGLRYISQKQVPKKIHLSWKNKNVLDSNYSLIKKGAKNLELSNPDWDIEVNDDEDVNRYIRDNIGKSSWELIKDRKITEKTDLWRLLKIYKEGGLYVDIDRYIDTPLSDIIKANTSCVIPTFQDMDFSQDFVLSCANNPMIERAISNNLFNRKNGQNLFYTAVCSYMHAVSEFLGGQKVERGNNPVYFNDIRKQIETCEYLETFREIGPEYHTLYRNVAGDFNVETFEKDKADFYNGESVVHWNANTQAKHTQLKNTNKQKLVFLQRNLFEEDFISELFKDCDVVYDTEMNRVIDDSVIVYSNGSSTENVWKYSAETAQNLFDFQNKLRNYFEQCKHKNCILVHLGDEHCHAEIDYYKNFKHVFRQYYRQDTKDNNVTFIPLGYKKGFLK